ncbi:MAG: 3-phosphoshikimate 1-carboxyvinyltransferase, partial [Solobacterium sp.]|nr:3-phosphoshikimate 1-carboxyvinyltransferase [Solobacterium sp.]
MKAVIGKRNGGEAVRIPSSKSLSHRALIAAALANGTSRIRNLVYNNDTEATIRALQCLGAEFHKMPDGTLEVSGAPRPFHCDQEPVDCGESGSTLRFLIPIFSLCDNAVTFTGQGRLMDRPQTVYEELFQKQGLLFESDGQYLRLKGPLR